ncbi:MAG: 30S ribosomal protein S9 [Chloroflexi bacterium RBG_13_54_8]|nr:MAG: 30S ribosomal protein S9 [Chloroflexi bacterium RBG_13_54_8]
MTEQAYFYGTGKRKTAIARVRLIPGNGTVVVNGKPLEEYLPIPNLQGNVLEPLRVTNTLEKFSAVAKVEGGGVTGQAGAIRHGIARALVKSDENLRPLLRQYGLLTRDARIKERKKYGLKRARKAPQYTKR